MRSTLILFFACTSLLFAETAERLWTWPELLETAYLHNADLRIESKEIDKAEAVRLRAGLSLPANPQLEFGYRKGKEPGQELEIGISQEFDIAGRRNARIHLADQLRLRSELLIQLKKIEIASKLRNVYISKLGRAIYLKNVNDHIEHTKSIRERFGPNYRDARLGAYVYPAMLASIMELGAEKETLLAADMQDDLTLRHLLGISDNIQLAPNIKGLPVPAPLEEILAKANNESSFVKLAKLDYEMAQANVNLAEVQATPTLHAFLAGGTDTTGYGPDALNQNVIRTKDNFVRLGLRIPLPVIDSNQGNVQYARAEADGRKIYLEKIQFELGKSVETAYKRYTSLRNLYEEYFETTRQYKFREPQMENALLLGRISFFEYWSEHERWHALDRRIMVLVTEAARAYAELELAAGVPIETDHGKE